MANELRKEFGDEVRISFRKILSAMLPHEDYDRELAYNLLMQLNKVLQPQEVYGYDNLLYKFLLGQFKLMDIYDSFMPDLSEEITRMKLEINVQNMATTKDFNLTKTLSEFGVVASVDVPEQFQNAIDYIYSGTLALYAELFEMKISTSQGINELSTLKDAILQALSSNYVSMCAELLTHGLVYERVNYHGFEGMRDFSTHYINELNSIHNSLSGRESAVVTFKDLSDHKNFNKKASGSVYEMFKWNIAPIDAKSPIMNSDVISVIGDEGTGKTHLVAMLATNCIMSGKDVIVMSGESSPEKVYHMILSNYIFQAKGQRYEWKELLKIDQLPEEDTLIINKCIAELASDKIGNINIVPRFTYETFSKEVADIINEDRSRVFGGVLIDHIGQLLTNGMWTDRGKLTTEKQRVDYLYYQAIILGDDLNVPFVMIAHTGSEAASQDTKGKATGTRIGGISGNTTKDADIAIWMRTTDAWKKQGLVQFVCKKFREAKFFDPFILKINFTSSHFEYSDIYQIKNVSDESAMDNVDELY